MKPHDSGVFSNKGFTLLEVMIALAIFGISALAILEQTSRSVLQQSQLENKTLALWVAENQFSTLQLHPTWPDTGTTETHVVFSQHNWTVSQAIEKTANPLLRRITIKVSRADQIAPLISLNGFMGKY